MSLSAAVVDALMAAGATREQLAAAVKADISERAAEDAAKIEKKRKGNRDRQTRKRDRDGNAQSRVTAVTTRDTRDTPPDGSPKDTQTPSLPPAEVSEPVGSSPQPRPWALPAGVSLQVWTDLLSNRKRKKAGNTPTAWKKFQNDLRRVSSQTGIPPPKLIEHAAASGWAGIYDPNEDKGHGRTNGMGRNQSDGLSPTTRAAIAVFGPPDPGHERPIPQ